MALINQGDSASDSKSKELLFYLVVGIFILVVLTLPSFALILLTRNNPEFKEFFSFVATQTKQDILNELNSASNPTSTQQNKENNEYPNENVPYPQLTPTTNTFSLNGKKLVYTYYQDTCNVGQITGDFAQFNSRKCYTVGELYTLRMYLVNYFSGNSQAVQLSTEQLILDIIAKGTPYNEMGTPGANN
jgi:cytoskeletal protein RodZ